MRKLIALTLCLCTLLSLGTGAFASTVTDETMGNSANTVLQYGVDVGYIVSIPESIQIDSTGVGTSSVSIRNALLPSGTKLDVSITGNSYADNAWHLKDVNDANNKLGYTISNNSVAFAPGDVVLSVNSGDAWNSTKTCNMQLSIIDDINKAGVYTDSLTFVVNGGIGTGVSTELAGTYRMLAKRPSTATAIYVEPSKTNNATWLLEQYGIPVDSGADLYEGYVLTEITPWLYSYDEAGVPYFFGAGDSQWGSRTQGDYSESIVQLFNQNEYIYALYAFGFQEFSVKDDVTVSDTVRRAFQGTHLKISDEVRDYYQTGVTIGDFTLGINVYETTWENILRSEALHHIEQLYKFDLRVENGIVMLYAQGKSAPLQYFDANMVATNVLATDIPAYYYDAEYDTYRTAYTCDIELSLELTCENCETTYPVLYMQTQSLCMNCAPVLHYDFFEICDGSYRYDDNMTWEEWTRSEYNVSGFYLSNDTTDTKVYAPNGTYVTDRNYVAVNKNDVINVSQWFDVMALNEMTFTLYGSKYKARQGMTWGEWVNSDYTSSWVVVDNQIQSRRSSNEFIALDDAPVNANDPIDGTKQYTSMWIG